MPTAWRMHVGSIGYEFRSSHEPPNIDHDPPSSAHRGRGALQCPMKTLYLLALSGVLAGTGYLAGRWHAGVDVGVDSATHLPAAPGATIRFYQSPMHPWVKSDRPGKCTICGMKLVPVYAGQAGYDTSGTNMVFLPGETIRIMGLQTARVTNQVLVRTLRVAGTIGEDESRHGVISAPVDGRIDGLAMSCEGQSITHRQPMLTIFSRPLLAAAEEYRNALPHGGTVVAAARRRLEQFGLVWEQIEAIPQRQPDDRYFGILAPLTGTIVKSYVAEGQYVKEGEKLFEIADFSRMWFWFTAYEADLPLLAIGQVVRVQTGVAPVETVRARVAFISPTQDGASRSARVRVVLENPERRIKNNTPATGFVELTGAEALTVPRSAVIWSDADPRVFVEVTPGTYEQRSVRLGRTGDVDWEILGGLRAGEAVVTQGNLLLDSQAQLNHLAAGEAPVAPPAQVEDPHLEDRQPEGR